MRNDENIALLNDVLGPPVHVGKVRYSYLLPPRLCRGRKCRGVYVTDQISSDDFVLGYLIRKKGEVLNTMAVHWKTLLGKRGYETDLIAFGAEIDSYLPPLARGKDGLYKRLTVVEEQDMLKGELLPRKLLAGSALRIYNDPNNKHVVYGHQLREGLSAGDELDPPLFTVSTKAALGHDEPLSAPDFINAHPGIDRFTLDVFNLMNVYSTQVGQAFYADMKFEFGRSKTPGKFVIADEVGTPDSSRIIRISDYKNRKPGTMPPGVDKDPVRLKMRMLGGIDKLDPANPEDQVTVKKIRPSDAFITDVTRTYLLAPQLITGRTLIELQAGFGMVA